jgi:sec-independent protein translocase protein TatC
MVDTPMPLTAHLAELRTRLFAAVIARAWFALCYTVKDGIIALYSLHRCSLAPRQSAAANHCPGSVSHHLKVCFLAGVFLALPFILYQLWKFVAPGLLEHEKKYTVPFIVGSTGLFYAGGVMFYLLLPLVIDFLLSFSSEDITAQLSVGYYVSFCIRMMIAFGVVFQLPMVVFSSSSLAPVVSHLIKHFSGAVVLTFVVAAVLTHRMCVADVYGITHADALWVSILVAKRIEKRREQRRQPWRRKTE